MKSAPETRNGGNVWTACSLSMAMRIRFSKQPARRWPCRPKPSPPRCQPPGRPAAPAAPPQANGEEPGAWIGRYKLVEKIGEGGGGVVWLAEQYEPVRRRVALKVIRLGMDTANVIARFELERQSLALMDHPNIARVLEAGATAAGPAVFCDGMGAGLANHRLLR